LKDIENRMSAQIPTSEIAKINASAGKAPVAVSDDTYRVIERGLKYASITNGLYDPTIYPIVSLWGVTTDKPRLPSDAEIKTALSHVNWKDVVLDPQKKTVFLTKPGMGIDLGSIAKGFSADRCAEVLKAQGINSGIINLGGNIFALGNRSDGQPWHVGVQDPYGDRGTYLGIVTAANKTLVTSGIYERFFEVNGKKYHHIFDTRTGYPVDSNIEAVTILTDKSFDADGRTLCCFVLDIEKGMAFAKQQGVDVMFITKDHKLIMSDGFKKAFELTDKSYSVVNP